MHIVLNSGPLIEVCTGMEMAGITRILAYGKYTGMGTDE